MSCLPPKELAFEIAVPVSTAGGRRRPPRGLQEAPVQIPQEVTAPGGPTDNDGRTETSALPRASLPSMPCSRDAAVGPLIAAHGREPVVTAGRAVLDEVRAEIAAAGPLPADTRLAAEPSSPASAPAWPRASPRPSPRPSTPRASSCTPGSAGPCSPTAAVEALAAVAAGYSTLALDLDTGKRVPRDRHVEGLLRELTGAEAATVANNNAAATVLILNTLARGKEVVVSRGQLVEIGGSFRMPDVMATSGAVLREVGTTNKTHLRDYEAAVTESTGRHPARPPQQLPHRRLRRGAAHRGARRPRPRAAASRSSTTSAAAPSSTSRPTACAAEPLVRASVRAGADVVCFSGDKLIGGPQCGIIVGKDGMDPEDPQESPGPGLPLRQAVPRRPRGDAQALPRPGEARPSATRSTGCSR